METMNLARLPVPVPFLCQVRWPSPKIETGCSAHEAGRSPVTLAERIEHFLATAPADRQPGLVGSLLAEAYRELRRLEAQAAGVFGGLMGQPTTRKETP